MPVKQALLPLFRLMRRGLTLAELIVVLAILAMVTAVTLPRLAGFRDWIAVDTAAQEVITAIAVARSAAVMQGTRSRAVIAADSLRIDAGGGLVGRPASLAGPGSAWRGTRGVEPGRRLRPDRLAWGLSNTTVVLRRGTRVATITVSRSGG